MIRCFGRVFPGAAASVWVAALVGCGGLAAGGDAGAGSDRGPQVGADADPGDGQIDAALPSDCSAGQTRCAGASYQICVDGAFATQERCGSGQRCVVGQGCVQSCSQGSDLVLVLDDGQRLMRFEPARLPNDPYVVIGTLSCATGPALPEFDPLRGQAAPFSMSVDRGGVAWVHFTSGEIFTVDPTTATCTNTGYEVGQQSYSVFALGFARDANRADAETLYITATGATTGSHRLGAIDPATLRAADVGTVTGSASPELAGDDQGRLYAFFPGASIDEIDIENGRALRSFPLTTTPAQPTAYAFAFAEGAFYVFTTEGTTGATTDKVTRVDAATGAATSAFSGQGRAIVGAGSATCSR